MALALEDLVFLPLKQAPSTLSHCVLQLEDDDQHGAECAGCARLLVASASKVGETGPAFSCALAVRASGTGLLAL